MGKSAVAKVHPIIINITLYDIMMNSSSLTTLITYSAAIGSLIYTLNTIKNGIIKESYHERRRRRQLAAKTRLQSMSNKANRNKMEIKDIKTYDKPNDDEFLGVLEEVLVMGNVGCSRINLFVDDEHADVELGDGRAFRSTLETLVAGVLSVSETVVKTSTFVFCHDLGGGEEERRKRAKLASCLVRDERSV